MSIADSSLFAFRAVATGANDKPEAENSSSIRTFYLPELDVLRFVAFVMVFLYHSLPLDDAHYLRLPIPAFAAYLLQSFISGAQFAVDLFFALSAYLITEIMLREYRVRGTVSMKAFYLRRILRIWPLYLTALFIGPFLGHWLAGEKFPLIYFLGFLFFFGNWVCGFKGMPGSSLSPLWSVSMEEQFYLTWPLVVVRWGHKLHYFCYGLLVIATLTRLVYLQYNPTQWMLWCSTLTRLDAMALGALLAYYLHGRIPQFTSTMRVLLVTMGGCMLVLGGTCGAPANANVLWQYPLAAVACIAIILGLMRMRPASAHLGRTMRAFVYLGRISYGLYVFHIAAVRFSGVRLTHSMSQLVLRLAEAFLLSLVAAVLSYRFLESPFLRLKDKYSFVASSPKTEEASPDAAPCAIKAAD